jgi:hypothetical protein
VSHTFTISVPRDSEAARQLGALLVRRSRYGVSGLEQFWSEVRQGGSTSAALSAAAETLSAMLQPVTVKGHTWTPIELARLHVARVAMTSPCRPKGRPSELLRDAARGRGSRNVPARYRSVPYGGSVPAGIRPDCNIRQVSWARPARIWWHHVTPFIRDDRTIAWSCVDRHHGRLATSQEVRDYLGSCVRRGLMDPLHAAEVQEYWLGGGPVAGDL